MSRKIKENLPSCTAILWTNTTLRDGTHPVKIRVTFKRKSKYYNVQSTANNTTQKLYLTVDQWNSARKENPRGKNKENKIQIDFALVSANEACTKVMENGKPFSLERFEAAYIAKESENGLMALFKHTLDDLFKEGRIGTYKTYGNAYNAFYAFRNGKDIEPADLTPRILKDFELYLRTPKGKPTIGELRRRQAQTLFQYISGL
jgi:integrase/recombinase XerD